MSTDAKLPGARETVREAHARGCHCMPVRDDDGNLAFTSRDDRCQRFADELTAAIEDRDAAFRSAVVEEMAEAVAVLKEFAAGNGGHLGYSEEETCTCVRCRAKRWLATRTGGER